MHINSKKMLKLIHKLLYIRMERSQNNQILIENWLNHRNLVKNRMMMLLIQLFGMYSRTLHKILIGEIDKTDLAIAYLLISISYRL
jgi:hypothetical protein